MHKLGLITGMAFEAAILRRAAPRLAKNENLIILCNGMGREGAATAAREALRQGATALMSFGIAGALDPALTAGTAVIASDIRDGTHALPGDPQWAGRLQEGLGAGPLRAVLAHTPGVLATAAAKAELFRATGAAAADMESYGIAEVAAGAGVPFAALRVIADGAQDSIPAFALRAIAADGRVDIKASLWGALTHPGQIPALIQLGRRTARAGREMRTLADLGLARSFFL